ncbi:MAG TPA: BtrH N-terminal domain-containing protein [Pseudomonadales bacterium]|nr:BtrH N-terminal domain-containing protein [Pseudomonadales bacterium]
MNNFSHRQAAHCESGVMSALLTHHGLPMSEPMAFGLAAAASFALIPLVKISGLPLVAYRMPPLAIIRGVQKSTGTRMAFSTFNNAERGMDALDAALDAGKIVGLQTSVFWLPYFPEGMRFHFNAHNVVVYGREGDDYLISDPVFETPVRCDRASLMKARFAKGALAAKGLQYFPTHIPQTIDYAKAIPSAIKRNVRVMTGAPLPFVGVRGIRYMGRQLLKLERDAEKRAQYLPLYLGHIVRMQEEIGTGGAGFRFIYAAFLRESSRLLESAVLKEAATAMTEAGDHWRLFALHASKMCKGREAMDVGLLNALLNGCADREAITWRILAQYAH